MESIIHVWGEPDEYEEDRNGEGQTAIYYSRKVYSSSTMKENDSND